MTVIPIMGEPFHFTVSSRSNPTAHHFCNWLHVTCSCQSFAYKNREHRERTGKNYVCAHLEAAKNQCWNEMLEDVREQLLAQ